MNYKVSDANSRAFTNSIISESKLNPVNAEQALLSSKNLVNNDVFKKLYSGVERDKATTLIINHKYKEAAEVYATCGKYGISIINNTDYINALGKYADSELVKKINLNDEDPTNYYGVGDIDNDGYLEVAVFEKNFSLTSNVFTPNNIKLFKYINGSYILFSTIQSDAEESISINVSKAKDNTNGVFVSGIVGMHSGIQSLYIIKNGKLVSALDKSIYSLYPSKIKDIDGDKILELSSLEKDPKEENLSNAEADEIITWYKWDGKNGLTTIKTQGLIQ